MVDLFELGTLKRQKQALIDLEEIINSENFDPRELYLNLKIMGKSSDDLIQRVKQLGGNTTGLVEKIRDTKNSPQYSKSIF